MAGRRASSSPYLVCLAAAVVFCFLLDQSANASTSCFAAARARASVAQGASQTWNGLAACGLPTAAASAACTGRVLAARRSRGADVEAMPRRLAVLPALFLAGGAADVAPEAALAQEAPPPTVDLPDRIKADPFELIDMANPDDKALDKKEFYMKKEYRPDTYQVVKHMKISASLDKGTPNMDKWNKRIKEEMDDWLAIYRRSDAVVGRQSFYSLYSAINTLASHFTSYGTKFPFPNKRRARFYELIGTTEKYLEKGK